MLNSSAATYSICTRRSTGRRLGLAAGVSQMAIYCDLVADVSRTCGESESGGQYRWLEGNLRHMVTQRW